MMMSSAIYTDVKFSCEGYKELWTVKEAEQAIHDILNCEIVTEIHECETDELWPYGMGTHVLFTTKGMPVWNQKLIEKAAKAIEELAICKIEAYSLGTKRIKVYETPYNTDYMFLMPEELNEIIAKRKEAWIITHPQPDS